MQYLRARYYRQDTARFISEDTYKGSVGDLRSHHTYNYIENDPINNIDPTGNMVDSLSSFEHTGHRAESVRVYEPSQPAMLGENEETIPISNLTRAKGVEDFAKEIGDECGTIPVRPEGFDDESGVDASKWLSTKLKDSLKYAVGYYIGNKLYVKFFGDSSRQKKNYR